MQIFGGNPGLVTVVTVVTLILKRYKKRSLYPPIHSCNEFRQ
jgi:hypothetical protein